MERIIEKLAIKICELTKIKPFDLEPGDCPYQDDRKVIDVRSDSGEPYFYKWRIYANRAEAYVKFLREEADGNRCPICEQLTNDFKCGARAGQARRARGDE